MNRAHFSLLPMQYFFLIRIDLLGIFAILSLKKGQVLSDLHSAMTASVVT